MELYDFKNEKTCKTKKKRVKKKKNWTEIERVVLRIHYPFLKFRTFFFNQPYFSTFFLPTFSLNLFSIGIQYVYTVSLKYNYYSYIII